MSYNALKILIVVTLLTLALLAIVILDPGALDALAVGLTRSPGALMAITVFLILFIATVVYLQRGLQPQQSRQPTPLDAEALRTLSGQVSEIANAISGFSMRLFRMEENFEEASRARLEIPEAERTALIARLRQTVEQAATDEILENMRASVETNQAQLELAEIIERQLQSTVGRLRSEIYTLTRRGTVNLALGVAMAGTGMGVLYSYVGGMSPSGGNFPLFA
ncbi:MAG: hypothetical protein F4Y14_02995 [Acidobacteria bacterium]|nr:hypothetical protein [Acidobacteriota bacterium]